MLYCTLSVYSIIYVFTLCLFQVFFPSIPPLPEGKNGYNHTCPTQQPCDHR